MRFFPRARTASGHCPVCATATAVLPPIAALHKSIGSRHDPASRIREVVRILCPSRPGRFPFLPELLYLLLHPSVASSAPADEFSGSPDRPEVRPVAGRQDFEGNRLLHALLNSPRTEHAHAIGVDQQPCHHPRIVRWLDPLFLPIGSVDNRKDPPGPPVAYEVDQIILRQPIVQARREQEVRIRVVVSERLAQTTLRAAAILRCRNRRGQFSDGPLQRD